MGLFSLLSAPIRILDAVADVVEELVVEPVVETFEDLTDKPAPRIKSGKAPGPGAGAP